jgi:hypothetical protein
MLEGSGKYSTFHFSLFGFLRFSWAIIQLVFNNLNLLIGQGVHSDALGCVPANQLIGGVLVAAPLPVSTPHKSVPG